MEEVANLRQNWGVTVRTRIRRRVEVTATSATSKRCSFARRSGSPQHPAQEKTSRGVDSWQLPQDVTSGGHCDDTQTIPAQLCYSNCHISKSRPSLLIRSRLSSPCSASLDRMRAMSSRRCRSPLVVFMMTVLICLLHVTAAKKAGETKTPLVRADVTTQRTFRGRGTLTKQQPKAGVLTIRSGAVHGVIAESRPLDFQTLKVVTQWDDYTTEVLLVSGRDYVYMINASQTSTNEEMTFIERLKWTAEPSLQDQCLAMGKQPYECNNFIRVVELLDDGRLYVCGTNAYKPLCRHYERSQFALPASDANTQYSTEKGCHSSCECPFDPTTSSAHLYTNTSNGFQLFTGVVGDYLGNKPLLMRNNNYVSSVNTWLSDPSFIKLIEYGEKVYLFFRETADQLETGSGMLTYSRVAQVCKDDLGGASAVLSSRWTTFLKARLECSIPSSPGTYSEGLTFNNLTSVSDVTTVMVNGQAVDVVFATFTTPWSWHAVSMSAVCMFPIRESIERLFNEGSFQAELLSSKIDLEQPHSAIPHQRAVPVPENQVPSPRPGSCRKDPLPDNVLNFAKNHQLMYTPVKPMFNQPIFLSESEVKVTQIVLDNKAGDEDNLVLYLGTESGTILRIRPRLHAAQGPKTVLLQELQIADKGGCRSGELKCGVLALHVARPSSTSPPSTKSSLFVAFTDRMAQVEAAKCDLYSNENCCNADPECGWHVENEKCVGRTRKNSNTLPPIRPIDEVPTDCEIPPPEPGCNHGTHTTTAEMEEPSGCDKRRPKSRARSSHRQGSQVDIRNVVATQNDDPRVRRCGPGTDQPCDENNIDPRLQELFTASVLPFVSRNFQETFASLHNDQQQQKLMTQLQEALEKTTNLILRNHKQESCLPTATVNSLTHAYPLLLREVEQWHSAAVKKMAGSVFQRNCWRTSRQSPCTAPVSVSLPLAPSLWEPMHRLLQDFDATCDTLPGSSSNSDDSSDCPTLSDTDSCKDERNTDAPHCRPKQCRFSRYAVDVKAFFRHANNTLKFLPARDVPEPFWKPVNVTVSKVQAVRGHLELLVNSGQPFLIQYSPVAEKVKIKFHYAAVHDCNLNEGACAGHERGCNADLEDKVDVWFTSILNQMKPSAKKCNKEVTKFERQNRNRDPQLRSRVRRTPLDNVPWSKPVRCRYMKKTAPRLPAELWRHVITRAQLRGASVEDNRITFNSPDHVRQFFHNRCSIEQPNLAHRTLGKEATRRRITYSVRMVVAREMPFVIERVGRRNKIQFKYFTEVNPISSS